MPFVNMSKMLFSALGLGLGAATLLCYDLARHHSIGFEQIKQEFTKANVTREISDAPGILWMIGGFDDDQNGSLDRIVALMTSSLSLTGEPSPMTYLRKDLTPTDPEFGEYSAKLLP